jgi:hypothetical protein
MNSNHSDIRLPRTQHCTYILVFRKGKRNLLLGKEERIRTIKFIITIGVGRFCTVRTAFPRVLGHGKIFTNTKKEEVLIKVRYEYLSLRKLQKFCNYFLYRSVCISDTLD